jgi:transcriptional regulator with GAF, ATPase, and Fis domain
MSGARDPRALLARARLALGAGAVDEAVRDLEAALETAAKERDAELEAELLIEMARALRARGTLDQAALCVEQAAQTAGRAGSPRLLARARVLEAEVLARLGDGARARARLEEAALLLDEAVARDRASGAFERALDAALEARQARELLASEAARGGPDRVWAKGGARSTNDAAGALPALARIDEEGAADVRGRALEATLHETARRLVEERDPAKVVTAVLDAAIGALGAERGFVLLAPEADDDTGAVGSAPAAVRPAPRAVRSARAAEPSALPSGLEIAAARNFDRVEVRRPDFKVSRTVIARAIAQGAPLLVRDAGGDAELSERSSVKAHRLRSIACIPFASPRPGGARGALYLDNRFGKGTFREADLPALSAFAAHAAVAVENARLHERSLRERRALVEARARAEELTRRLETELSRAGAELGETRARLDETATLLASRSGLGGIVGASPSMQAVYALIGRVKDADVPVLIRGESGTGKELVARAIHFESVRKKEPFVSESCAALPETLVESTLFGHEAGSFTGALGRRAGLFELAGQGTLFLDEVGELTPGTQAKLLRVLEEKRVRRVGGSTEIALAARVVCATNRDLEAMVRAGTFREDLFFRLNVFALRLPPLRERREDIPLLLEKLVEKSAAEGKRAPRLDFAPAAKRALLAYAWPGNVRELGNEVRRLLALGTGTIALEDLSAGILGSTLPAPSSPAGQEGLGPTTLEEGERRTILAALRATKGNKLQAAEVLAIPRGTLWHKMKQHKIREEDYEA